jgi:hypothetical protein
MQKALAQSDVDMWIAAATESVLEEDKAEIVERFARLKRDFQTFDQAAPDQPAWSGLAEASLVVDPDGVQYRRRLASQLGTLVCDRDAAPYLAHGLVSPLRSAGSGLILGEGRLAALGDQLEGVRKRMKAGRAKTEACPGVAGLTEDDWRQLDEIKPN